MIVDPKNTFPSQNEYISEIWIFKTYHGPLTIYSFSLSSTPVNLPQITEFLPGGARWHSGPGTSPKLPNNESSFQKFSLLLVNDQLVQLNMML